MDLSEWLDDFENVKLAASEKGAYLVRGDKMVRLPAFTSSLHSAPIGLKYRGLYGIREALQDQYLASGRSAEIVLQDFAHLLIELQRTRKTLMRDVALTTLGAIRDPSYPCAILGSETNFSYRLSVLRFDEKTSMGIPKLDVEDSLEQLLKDPETHATYLIGPLPVPIWCTMESVVEALSDQVLMLQSRAKQEGTYPLLGQELLS